MMQDPPEIADQTSAREERVLAKALERAAGMLGLTQTAVARIIGVSGAKVGRIYRGQAKLDPASKEGELALLLLRVFRSLDTVVGNDPRALRAWFHAHNHHLEGVPAERIMSAEGLVHVAEYLDGVRGTL